MIAGKIKIQVSKTSDGKGDYLQVMSDDMLSVNLVLVAQEILITDDRERSKALLKDNMSRARRTGDDYLRP